MTKKMIDGVVSDYTAEEEAQKITDDQAWVDGAFDRKIEKLRIRRNALLLETDFYALSDVTMSEDMTNYREALRDLPAGKDTVQKVNDATWPTKP